MSLLRLLRSLPLRIPGARQPVEQRLGQIRGAMLAMLQAHPGQAIQRVAQRVRFANDLEALWYLRQDMLLALSAVDGEASARRQMRRISQLFEGCLPGTLVPRTHQRFTA